MRPRDLAELLLLAAIWGASFLFMRVAAADFGPIALAAVRVAGASLLLVPLVALGGGMRQLAAQWKPLALLGLTNSALPFVAFSIAALSLDAGLSAIFNATTPLWGALFAAFWLGERLAPARIGGLALGFAGVAFLASQRASFGDGGLASSGVAVLACLAATLLYAFSAAFAKKRLAGTSPLAIAAGSQLAAALALALPALQAWPAATPGAATWGAAAALALLCTGVAYLLYFRLIARAGPTNALAVTFLIPAFAVGWGWIFLGERVDAPMLAGCALILAGTALAVGLVRLPARR